MRLYALCAIVLAACAFEPSGPEGPLGDDTPDPGIPGDVDAAVVADPPIDPTPPEPTEPPPDPPTVECRLEGEHLGVQGATVEVGFRSYVFESWQTAADGSPIGFTLTGPPEVRYEVRTEADRDYSRSLVYEGTDRITRVDFCVSFDEDD